MSVCVGLLRKGEQTSARIADRSILAAVPLDRALQRLMMVAISSLPTGIEDQDGHDVSRISKKSSPTLACARHSAERKSPWNVPEKGTGHTISRRRSIAMVCCQGVVTRHLQRQTPSKDPQFPVLTASSSPGMVICTRRGCGVDFDPAAPSGSSSSSCFFHPGAPVFHEGSKSWSCCKEVNKPVLVSAELG